MKKKIAPTRETFAASGEFPRRPRLRPSRSSNRSCPHHPSSDQPVLGSNSIFSSHTGHSSLRSYHSYMHPR
jgi:hypothetical protein